MTVETGDALRGEAIGWHLRIAEGSVEDWEAFTEWLGASPAHPRAYDAIEMLDADAGPAVAAELSPELIAANDDLPVVSRNRWLGGSAAAAMLAVAVAFGSQMLPGRDLYEVSSAPGAIRNIVVASGDIIVLNGNSKVVLDRNNVRFASLKQGEASFEVTHDAAKPFIVEVGDERIQDVGTVFNVVRSDDGVRVAVAEGSILYNPGREAVRLGAGDALSDPGGSSPALLAKVDPIDVGAWRSGRLGYEDAPLTRIAGDLERATGQRVRVSPALAGRLFSGTIRLKADHAVLFADVAQLLDVEARHGNDGWTLVARPRAVH